MNPALKIVFVLIAIFTVFGIAKYIDKQNGYEDRRSPFDPAIRTAVNRAIEKEQVKRSVDAPLTDKEVEDIAERTYAKEINKSRY